MVPKIFCLSRGTSCDDCEIWGPNWLGTICPGGQNFWGPFVHGDRISWGLFLKGDQFLWGLFVQGDRKWRTGSPGIKWVRDQMRRSPSQRELNCLVFSAQAKLSCSSEVTLTVDIEPLDIHALTYPQVIERVGVIIVVIIIVVLIVE